MADWIGIVERRLLHLLFATGSGHMEDDRLLTIGPRIPESVRLFMMSIAQLLEGNASAMLWPSPFAGKVGEICPI